MIFTNDQNYNGLYCRCYFDVSPVEFNQLFILQFSRDQHKINEILKGKEPIGYDYPCRVKGIYR
jgi:hypothetical protein